MEPREALQQLREWAQRGDSAPPPAAATEAVARWVGDAATDGNRREVGGSTYRVEEVTWPVSQSEDGTGAFANPRPVAALLRGDALLADVREEYNDGRAPYPIVGQKVGRWRRFRSGSPGERGYDVHLAADEELRAFAAQADAVVVAFGLNAGN